MQRIYMDYLTKLSPRRTFLASLGMGAGAIGIERLFERGVLAEELQRRLLTP